MPAGSATQRQEAGGEPRWLRRAADAARLAIIGTAAVSLALGDGSAALKALLLLGPACLGRFASIPDIFDLLFAVGLSAEAVGTAVDLRWSDTLSHFVLPMLSAPIFYGALRRLGAGAPAEAGTGVHLFRAVVMTVAAVMAAGVLWEIVEWSSDHWLGTDYSQGALDTLGDLLADAAGAITGALLVAIWLRRSRPEGGARTPG